MVLVVSWSNCQNFSQKFNFKLLSPSKNQNLSYGSKVTAISNNKKRSSCYKFQIKKNSPHPPTRTSRGLVVTNFKWKKNCPHPTTRKLFCLVVTSPRDKIIFSLWMEQADSNKITNKFQMKKKNCPHPTTRTSRGLVVTNFKWKKKLSPPHHEKIIWSRGDKFQMKKSCPHPTTRTSCCLVVTNLNYKKNPVESGCHGHYVVRFSAQLCDDMYKCHQLT